MLDAERAGPPVVYVFLCPGCGGYAPLTGGDYSGALSGHCQGCGARSREVHKFAALIDSASGCRCTTEHERRDGDISVEVTVAEGDRVFAAVEAESRAILRACSECGCTSGPGCSSCTNPGCACSDGKEEARNG